MKDVTEQRPREIFFSAPPTRPLARRGDATLCAGDFLAHINGLVARLEQRSESSWGVCCEDAFYFLCGFCAVLASGKRLVIPPNLQPGTLAAFDEEVDGWIVDGPDAATEGRRPCVAVAGAAATTADDSLCLPDDAVVDLFTSGTTGMPKRIRKFLHQLTAEVEVLESLWGGVGANATVVATVPHFHIYGLLFRLLWPLRTGRVFDVMAYSNPEELRLRLRAFERVLLISSPAQLGRWPELIDLKALVPPVAVIFSSGGPLPAKAAEAYVRQLGAAPIEVYGSSETGGIGWRSRNPDAPDGDAWTPLPRVDVRIGADGALHVRSPFAGAQWFATADGMQWLEQGRFRLLDRLDRVVKIEEKRLSLPEMERRVGQHPWVDAAALVALEGERRVLGAVVRLTLDGRARLLRDGKRHVVGELRAFLHQYYEAALLPRRWRFPETLPHNDRGKLSVDVLAALFVAAD